MKLSTPLEVELQDAHLVVVKHLKMTEDLENNNIVA
jgi:hypothetical protein